MPQSRPIDLILTVDQSSGRVLGAEAVGADAVDKSIDIIATAIWAGLTVDGFAVGPRLRAAILAGVASGTRRGAAGTKPAFR